MQPNYLSLVEEIITQNCKQPLHIVEKDLEVGIELLTKIAIEKILQKSSLQESTLKDKKTSDCHLLEGDLSNLTHKIKAFVQKRASDFIHACNTGFPFSLLQSTSAENALKHVLKNYDSILSYFLTAENNLWLTETELEVRFGSAFKRLQIRAIATTCSDLKYLYTKKSDLRAGYYLLWLIKQAAGCQFEIPQKNSFNHSTVSEILSQFFLNEGLHEISENLIEILHYRASRINSFLYDGFLDDSSLLIFLNFTVTQIVSIPLDKWPCKIDIITNILETVTKQDKISIIKALSCSEDLKTAVIGDHLLAAAKAKSLNIAILHFNALKELLPSFNNSDIEYIFGYIITEFREDPYICRNDSDFTKRLQFKDQVFVHNSLMVGIYQGPWTSLGKELPLSLLGFDMNSEKLLWGIQLKSIMHPSDYSVMHVENLISIQFKENNETLLINIETGEIESTVKLAGDFKQNKLYITPQRFIYQLVRKEQDTVLIGGKFINNEWMQSFEVIAPMRILHGFSTHCGFRSDFREELILAGPTGDFARVQNCLDAYAEGNQIYLIEKDPSNENKCLLTIRTLKTDPTVLSDVETRFELLVKNASFGKLCQNGQFILFSNDRSIFIDLNSKKVIYSNHKLPLHPKPTINIFSGEVFAWDCFSKNIWKISTRNAELMGSFDGNDGTVLLHVDKDNHLYFC